MLPSGAPGNSKRPTPLIWALLFLSCCTEPVKTPLYNEHATGPVLPPTEHPDSAELAAGFANPPSSTEQVSQYIRRIFQDRDGNMWFGTTSDGAVRYDASATLGTSGQTLTYFNSTSGLGSDWVSSIAQDAQGHIWFGTRDGIARYDGQQFTRFTTKDGLADDHVHCLLIDRKGWLWAATEEGVSCFDPSAPLRTSGKKLSAFPIPAADLSKFPYQEGPKRINWMIEDKAGNIWFASNGGGAYRYDGKALTNYSEKEGLCNNFVQTIIEDRAGNLWFGTRYGGVCRYDGNTFTGYSRKELSGDDVSSLYQDSNGMIWIGVTRVGLCSYDGKAFRCYNEKDGAGIRVIFNALEDTDGQLWFGTGEGVYRLVGGAFANWTKEDALDPRPR